MVVIGEVSCIVASYLCNLICFSFRIHCMQITGNYRTRPLNAAVQHVLFTVYMLKLFECCVVNSGVTRVGVTQGGN